MNDTRYDTLTEHAFKTEKRVRDLETNVLMLGVACIASTCAVMYLVNRRA